VVRKIKKKNQTEERERRYCKGPGADKHESGFDENVGVTREKQGGSPHALSQEGSYGTESRIIAAQGTQPLGVKANARVRSSSGTVKEKRTGGDMQKAGAVPQEGNPLVIPKSCA